MHLAGRVVESCSTHQSPPQSYGGAWTSGAERSERRDSSAALRLPRLERALCVGKVVLHFGGRPLDHRVRGLHPLGRLVVPEIPRWVDEALHTLVWVSGASHREQHRPKEEWNVACAPPFIGQDPDGSASGKLFSPSEKVSKLIGRSGWTPR